jgi:hypothetical protein
MTSPPEATPRWDRFLSVLIIRIGNVNRLVEPALRVSLVEYVVVFRSLVISLLLFGANRRTSERHFVGVQNFSLRN